MTPRPGPSGPNRRVSRSSPARHVARPRSLFRVVERKSRPGGGLLEEPPALPFRVCRENSGAGRRLIGGPGRAPTRRGGSARVTSCPDALLPPCAREWDRRFLFVPPARRHPAPRPLLWCPALALLAPAA